MPEKQKAVLLVNVGTPDKADTASVRRYLSQFLNDKRIMDIPWLFRKILVNLVIVPFRAPRSARLYQRLWTPEGSPLLTNTQKFATALRRQLDGPYHVY
ncbi:MAG TPA: ferrochelatase, partial [Bacteroidetes bacterium]|nr:ferrochelatase [Bacteroidota bacterium]